MIRIPPVERKSTCVPPSSSFAEGPTCPCVTTDNRQTMAAAGLDDLNSDTLSTVFSYLPRRNDWTNLATVNRGVFDEYQGGLLTSTPPPWPSCKALYDPSSLHSTNRTASHSSHRQPQRHEDANDNVGERNDVNDEDDDDEDYNVPDFFDDDNPHHPLQLCCFSPVLTTAQTTGERGNDYEGQRQQQFLAVADKEGNVQLWHRCFGLVKSWNVLSKEPNRSNGQHQESMGHGDCPSRSALPVIESAASTTVRSTGGVTTLSDNSHKKNPTLRYLSLKRDDHRGCGAVNTATSMDELLLTMDSEGTLTVWRIQLIARKTLEIETKSPRPRHQVTFLRRSVGQWEPRMFVTPTGDVILIEKKSPTQFPPQLRQQPGTIRLVDKRDPIFGRFKSLEMDRTAHHLPIHFESSNDGKHFLIYATKRKTPTSATVEFVLQTNHCDEYDHDIDTTTRQRFWNRLPSSISSQQTQRPSSMSQQQQQQQQHVLRGTGTYHIQCETPQILEEQIERTCAASFFHRAALSPDGKTLAVVEFGGGGGGGGQQPAIRGAVQLVFRETRSVLWEEGSQFRQQQRQLLLHQHPHRLENNDNTNNRDGRSSRRRRRCVLLPSHSRYIKMSFSQDSRYLLVQFRHRARLGRSMKLYCRNLIVNVESGNVLTSFAPFASHAKSCEYFNHGPYRQLNSVRGTKVLFVPNGSHGSSSSASVLSAGFVGVESEGTSFVDLMDNCNQNMRGEHHHNQHSSVHSSSSHSQATMMTPLKTTHVPGFSITNIDLQHHENIRLHLMNLSIEELLRRIRVELHRAKIPSAIASNKGRIVDWILQLHNHEQVIPILDRASSSHAFSYSSPEIWEDDASSSSSLSSNGSTATRRDSIDSNSSHSESSVASV